MDRFARASDIDKLRCGCLKNVDAYVGWEIQERYREGLSRKDVLQADRRDPKRSCRQGGTVVEAGQNASKAYWGWRCPLFNKNV